MKAMNPVSPMEMKEEKDIDNFLEGGDSPRARLRSINRPPDTAIDKESHHEKGSRIPVSRRRGPGSRGTFWHTKVTITSWERSPSSTPLTSK